MRIRRLLVLLVLLTTPVAACGTSPEPDTADTPGAPAPTTTAPTTPPTASPTDAKDEEAVEALEPGPAAAPDDFRWGTPIFHFLAQDGRVVDEEPWTACLGNGCWDGAPGLGNEVPSVGSPDALYFALDYPGWRFHWVSFNPVDDECGGRSTTVRATAVSDRVFRVDPVGRRGEWRIDVFGRGPEGGDAVTSVRWTTPTVGSVPDPTATGSLFTDDDGERVAPYGGPELHVADLARTPARATGTWTVTDGAGHSVTVPLVRQRSRCAREGSLSFHGRELALAELERLTGRAVTYTVRLTLDGEVHTGTSRWPQDETAEPPYTRFAFDPPLPAFRP
ncbi:hypothetical protein [Nocardioides abyssi]|uniref:Lipoprotein n=1 Tax=Nocardioides abyssi TaxID=3058370 RepID=A0ABT8EZ14_9ACTN|nr:hypothetical protein [Nocardioides abyssi]MDN4163441.1 hypothetical protein [Nocardioides abyssi]